MLGYGGASPSLFRISIVFGHLARTIEKLYFIFSLPDFQSSTYELGRYGVAVRVKVDIALEIHYSLMDCIDLWDVNRKWFEIESFVLE
jgi:hypothetical protein